MKRQLSVLLLVICIVSFVLPFSASASEMTCKVRFMLRYPGGAGDVACADPVEVVCGECLGDLLPDEPEPPAEGLVFLGWVDKYGEAVTEETVVSDDMRIYTAWGKLLTISFDANEGSWGDADFTELEALSGPVEELPEEPERDGYVFDSWNTKPDGSGEKFDIGRDLQENTTVYAQWKRIFLYIFMSTRTNMRLTRTFAKSTLRKRRGFWPTIFLSPIGSGRDLRCSAGTRSQTAPGIVWRSAGLFVSMRTANLRSSMQSGKPLSAVSPLTGWARPQSVPGEKVWQRSRSRNPWKASALAAG